MLPTRVYRQTKSTVGPEGTPKVPGVKPTNPSAMVFGVGAAVGLAVLSYYAGWWEMKNDRQQAPTKAKQ
ncbi:hypothetical protein Moror_10385 [Moniliophthora roreri MCA 2997]|uniref:Uncharacterized protein n=2 Tax=Moniliophthora roreri TaxID=221103 RepID=V2YJT5_MONRO|nr:hypothetical protein Moror_10385 [Moniliophthora roreri MCA 2997]